MSFFFQILEYLSLSHNPIGEGIHESAFWNLRALKHLDLKDISAPYLSSDFFKTLTNLSTLDISWNPISAIPLLPISLQELDLSGTQVTSFNNLYLPQLRELRLNYMLNLTLFDLDDLENLTSLETLSMIGCKRLTQLSLWPQIGVVLPRLQRFSIKGCGLETLGVDLRALVQRTAVVDLANNPWKCDCKLEWIGSLNSTRNLGGDIRWERERRELGYFQLVNEYRFKIEWIQDHCYLFIFTSPCYIRVLFFSHFCRPICVERIRCKIIKS